MRSVVFPMTLTKDVCTALYVKSNSQVHMRENWNHWSNMCLGAFPKSRVCHSYKKLEAYWGCINRGVVLKMRKVSLASVASPVVYVHFWACILRTLATRVYSEEVTKKVGKQVWKRSENHEQAEVFSLKKRRFRVGCVRVDLQVQTSAVRVA